MGGVVFAFVVVVASVGYVNCRLSSVVVVVVVVVVRFGLKALSSTGHTCIETTLIPVGHHYSRVLLFTTISLPPKPGPYHPNGVP